MSIFRSREHEKDVLVAGIRVLQSLHLVIPLSDRKILTEALEMRLDEMNDEDRNV